MKHIRSILSLVLIFALLLSVPTLLSSCAKDAESTGGGSEIEDTSGKTIYRLTFDKTNYVRIDIKNYGTIIIELYPDVAPETVAWFQELVATDYYKKSTFDRLVKGSMVEGGIPKDEEKQSSLAPLRDELAINTLSHTNGVVSLCRDSQTGAVNGKFFICLGDCSEYDETNVAFGKVVHGLDVLENINNTMAVSQRPVDELKMMLVRFVFPDSVGGMS